MHRDTQATDGIASEKRAYSAPTLTVFGSLRELTLDQKVTPMPSDNEGEGKGGKT